MHDREAKLMAHNLRFLFMFCLALACCAPARAAQMYIEGTVIVVSPKKDAVNHSIILGRFDEVLRRRKEPEPAVQDGLGVMLETAYRYYWEGEPVDLFLRLFASDAQKPVRLSLLGSFFINVEDLKNGKIDVGQYVIDPGVQKELVDKESEVIGLGPATPDNHEVLAVFNLTDFAFVNLPEGVYRINIEYINDSRPRGAWCGRIKSNPVIVEVIGGAAGSERVRKLRSLNDGV
jgi:hypothetical protein